MFLLKSGVAAFVHFRIYQFKPHFLSRFSYACAAAMLLRRNDNVMNKELFNAASKVVEECC